MRGRTAAFMALFAVSILVAEAKIAVGDWRAEAPRRAGDWSPAAPFELGAYPSLPLGADGRFRILVLTDIQIGLAPFRDAEALDMVARLVAKTDPDLVLTAGDNGYGPLGAFSARRLAALLGKSGKPWGVVLGNHDSEWFTPRSWYGDFYARAPGSLFSPGPRGVHGVGNWAIWLRGPEGRPAFALLMLDSNEYRRYPGEPKGYDVVYPDQIDWYEWMVRGLSAARYGSFAPEAGRVLPSLLILHIPPPQIDEALAALDRGEVDPAAVSGRVRETPCPPLEDSGLFARVLALGSTGEILFGHDHLNDLSLPWRGVRLSYVLKTGPASYHDDALLGGTLVTVAPAGGRGPGEAPPGGDTRWVAASERVFMARRK